MTLVEFLLARVAEDERGVDVGGTFGSPRPDIHFEPVPQRMDYGEMLIGPARVLAECEAKRRIVNILAAWSPDPVPPERVETAEHDAWRMLLVLASVYADHADFDPAWRA